MIGHSIWARGYRASESQVGVFPPPGLEEASRIGFVRSGALPGLSLARAIIWRKRDEYI